jgi:uncharacterized protein (DUF427 family)
MLKAVWNGETLAESADVIVVDGYHYFPADSVREDFLQPSEHRTSCWWKGRASYYDIEVDGQRNENAAWYYPSTLPKAKHFEGYVAFWKGVEIRG